MKSKAGNPALLLEGRQASPLIRAYFELNHLKQLYRQGWLRRGMDEIHCETVAEHSFAVAVLAIWLAQAYFPELDLCRLIQMALVHDLGEIYAGDIIPADWVEPEQKHHLEEASIQRILEGLSDHESLLRLWQEFEQGATPEARLVRQVDRLEMGIQAEVYKLQGYQRMDEFISSARRALQDSPLIELLTEIEELE